MLEGCKVNIKEVKVALLDKKKVAHPLLSQYGRWVQMVGDGLCYDWILITEDGVVLDGEVLFHNSELLDGWELFVEEEYVNVGTVGHVDYSSGKVVVNLIRRVAEDSPPEYQECVKQTGHKKPFYQKGRW